MMPVFPLGTRLEDEINYLTSAVHVTPFSKHVLVYYVPGNPGLIEYYRNFLQFLTKNLSQDETSRQHQTQFHVYGESLTGFELMSSSDRARHTPYSLDDIEWNLMQQIDQKAQDIIETHELKTSRLPVILIGHSIGTWLALQSIAWSKNASRSTSHDSAQPSLKSSELIGGVLLFPTIVDIAKSPNGLAAGVCSTFY